MLVLIKKCLLQKDENRLIFFLLSQKYFFLALSVPVDLHSFLPWELKIGSGKGTDFKSCQGTETYSASQKVNLKGFFLPFRKA